MRRWTTITALALVAFVSRRWSYFLGRLLRASDFEEEQESVRHRRRWRWQRS
jgi:hypothetical protein